MIAPDLFDRPHPLLPASCDVAVVGGGPAGLAAATRLRALGAGSVLVLDREPEAGGIPRHCGHYPFGLREVHRLMKGPDYARRLVTDALAAGVEIHTGVTVVRLESGPALALTTADGPCRLQARAVLLATGARETSRAGRLIGGDRPLGVLSTGALQAMVYLGHRAPFRRPLILGTELVSFSAILTCRHQQIRPAGMVEARTRPTAFRLAPLLPRLLGIPVWYRTEVVAIHGRQRVEGVTLRTASPGGPERAWTVEADGVIVSGGFTPESTLVRHGLLAVDPATGGPVVDQFGATSEPGIHAAGNLLRPIETAGWSWREGYTIAEVIARRLSAASSHAPATLSGSARRQLTVSGRAPEIRYVMPQRLTLPPMGSAEWDPDGFGALQVRVTRSCRGKLTVRQGGRMLWRRPVRAVPEQRLLIPLAPLLPQITDNEIIVSLEETA